jgi:hypothetical protein
LHVLAITHVSETDLGGGADRHNGIIAALASLGHDVERFILPIRKPLAKRLVPRRPWWYLTPSREWEEQATARIERADLVLLCYLPVAAAAMSAVAASHRRPPIIYDAQNDECRLAIRIGRSYPSAIAQMEDDVVSTCDITWMPGQLDARTIAARHPAKTVVNVPNGAEPMPDLSDSFDGPGSVFTYGSWEYEPNMEGLLRLARAHTAQSGTLRVYGKIGRPLGQQIAQLREPSGCRPTWKLEGFAQSRIEMARRARGPAIIPVWTGGGTKLRAVQLGSLGIPIFAPAEAVSGLPRWFAAAAQIEENPIRLLERALAANETHWSAAGELRKRVHEELTWEPIVKGALQAALS